MTYVHAFAESTTSMLRRPRLSLCRYCFQSFGRHWPYRGTTDQEDWYQFPGPWLWLPYFIKVVVQAHRPPLELLRTIPSFPCPQWNFRSLFNIRKVMRS